MNPNIHKLIICSLLALTSLLSVIFLWKYNLLISITLLIIGIITLVILNNKKYIYLYFIIGIIGALAEIIAISYGVWTYANPNYFNIPIWLPFLWGEAALFITSLSKFINQ